MSNPEVRVVLDWDRVQFDDRRFKADIFDHVQALTDLEMKTILHIYEATKDDDGYNDAAMADAIAAEANVDPAIVLEALRSKFDAAPGTYIYPDAHQFDDAVYGVHPMSVITAGLPSTQQKKIDTSGHAEQFDSIHIVPNVRAAENKAEVIRELHEATGNSIVFFDDKISTIMHHHEVFRNNPHILPIFIDREAPDSETSLITWNKLSVASLAKIIPMLNGEVEKPAVIGLQQLPGGRRGIVTEA